MSKIFLVEETKLASFIDAALKVGGLTLHAAAQNLLSSLTVHESDPKIVATVSEVPSPE